MQWTDKNTENGIDDMVSGFEGRLKVISKWDVETPELGCKTLRILSCRHKISNAMIFQPQRAHFCSFSDNIS